MLFGTMLINKIGMNQHTIEEGYSYDGDPLDDLQQIAFYKSFISNITNKEIREKFVLQLQDLENCALQHID